MQKSNDNDIFNSSKVTVFRIYNLFEKELNDSVILYIDTLTFDNRKNYVYSESLMNDSSFSYSYSIEKDSFYYINEYCKVLDTINLGYKDRDISIFKCDYNIERSQDEESYIYWNRQYGLVAIDNYPWNILILFENDEMKGFAKEIFYNYILDLEKKKQEKIHLDMQKRIKGSC
jgi:hypothetical protein